jgi:putative heme degradation protein
VSSALLPVDLDHLEVDMSGEGPDDVYDFEALLRRAGGSADVAVRLVHEDLAVRSDRRGGP